MKFEYFTNDDYRPYWTVFGIILTIPIEEQNGIDTFVPDIEGDLKSINIYCLEPFDLDYDEIPNQYKILVKRLIGSWEDHESGVRCFEKVFSLNDLDKELIIATKQCKLILDKYPGSKIGFGLCCLKPFDD